MNRSPSHYFSLSDQITPEHQRPEDVKGDWELVAPEDRNIHQRVAAATGGWVTLPTAVTLAGAELTRRGIINVVDGFAENTSKRVAIGVGQVVVGRIADIVDGVLATRLGVRGEAGALADSAADKALAAFALVKLSRAGVIQQTAANIMLAEQGIIAVENIGIKALKGEPNPVATGKDGAALLWAAIPLRILGFGLEKRGHSQAGKRVNRGAAVIESGSYVLNGHAALAYGKRLITTFKANRSIKQNMSAATQSSLVL